MTDLEKVITRRKKRLGRGYGSGKGGHTSSRGQKGQKARSKIGPLFEGIKVKKSLLTRLPLQRGESKFRGSPKPLVINLDTLNKLAASEATIETLAKAGLIDLAKAKKVGVKILGEGKITKKIKVSVPVSKSAAAKIKKAGGEILNA